MSQSSHNDKNSKIAADKLAIKIISRLTYKTDIFNNELEISDDDNITEDDEVEDIFNQSKDITNNLLQNLTLINITT